MKPVRYSYAIASALLVGGAAVSLITGVPAGAQVAQNDAQSINSVVPFAGAPTSFADLTQQLQPAVVNIATRQRITVNNNPFAGSPFADLFGSRGTPTTREAQSLGSGFLISADGYVVTNNHVIQPEGNAQLQEVTVTTPDGTEYRAEVVGTDPDSDLAVLKISSSKTFPFVKFGDSRQARVGDWVIAIGNPFGLSGTVTAGIVSAVYQTTGAGGAYDRYLQTDTSINRGNSGGPLFDMRGNVIGINNAIFSPSGGSVGIGFAIPAETAEPIVQKLIAGEEIKRGYIGVRIQPMNDDLVAALGLKERKGEFIQSVQPGDAAANAGMQAGDVVLKVDGKDVTANQSLSFLIANTAPGRRIPLEVLRDGKAMTLQVTVGQRPSADELAKQQQQFDPDAEQPMPNTGEKAGIIEEAVGIQVMPLTARIASQLGINATSGLVVTAVDANADAARKGLQRGTVILAANGAAVAAPADLEAAVRAAKSEGRNAILLRVQARGGQPVLLPVRLR